MELSEGDSGRISSGISSELSGGAWVVVLSSISEELGGVTAELLLHANSAGNMVKDRMNAVKDFIFFISYSYNEMVYPFTDKEVM
jgi:hypothetical protein